MWREDGQKKSEENLKNGKLDGLAVNWHKNGQKDMEGNYKDGEMEGLHVLWFSNGQKWSEENYNKGELISEKYWNRKGEPVDSQEEGLK